MLSGFRPSGGLGRRPVVCLILTLAVTILPWLMACERQAPPTAAKSRGQAGDQRAPLQIPVKNGPVTSKLPPRPVDSDQWTREYDADFRKYTKRFFGVGFDWRWFKAQAIAESTLDPTAQSGVGAKGIMQIMEPTFEEIREKYAKGLRIEDIIEPSHNIAAGISYDKYLYDKWKAERPFTDKMCFTFGAYNAGFANLVRAQKIIGNTLACNENTWPCVIKAGPRLPSWRWEETAGYVEKITHLMGSPVESKKDDAT